MLTSVNLGKAVAKFHSILHYIATRAICVDTEHYGHVKTNLMDVSWTQCGFNRVEDLGAYRYDH